MEVDDSSVELLVRVSGFPDVLDEGFDLIDLLMDAVLVSALGIEEYFFFDVVAVDEDVFVFVGFGVEQGDAVFECEIELQVGAEVDDFGDPVDEDVCFWLHFFVRMDIPS